MLPKLNLVRLSAIPILQQLQWEEALLRTNAENWCLLNMGSPPAIVMGISGKAEQLIHFDKLRNMPISLIRRFSGGGTVIVDENTLFVTLICQSKAIAITPFPKSIMQWTADNIYRPLFPSHCFALQENDYALNDRKWGGNAQSIVKGRWLHHTSILWDYREEFMDILAMPPKMPGYRQGRSHKEFLCRLREIWNDCELLIENIVKQLQNTYEIVKKTENDLVEICGQPHRKMTEVIKLKEGNENE